MLLEHAQVLTHPLIVGELACVSLRNRVTVLGNLTALPATVAATHEEALQLVEDRKLWGRGIGWVDAHLLASALISNCRLWTLDERLDRAARDTGVKWPQS